MENDARIGSVLDRRYRILEIIASGEMGRVYRAERIKIGRAVAIKFMHEWSAAKPGTRQRFDVEAQAMARLDHPNCAAVIDVGVDQGVPYVVMDYASGETLRAVLDRGPLEPGLAVDIMLQVLRGLAHAHEQGIIHRDIKPANIMVGEATGVGVQVKILDFGLARLGHGDARLTAAGSTVGTPSYMAPEQCVAGAIDARTDVYACGILLFEMLTGAKPFQAEDPMEILEMQCREPPPRLGALVGRDFGPLEDIVARALAKDPAARFQSAAELMAALEGAGASVAAPSAPAPVTGSMMTAPMPATARQRLPGGSRAALAIALAGLGLIAVLAAALTSGEDEAAADAGELEDPAETALELEDDLPDSLPDLPGVAEARELLGQGRKNAAIRALVELRREHPDSAEIHYLLGRLYLDKRWWNDGLEAYRKAIELDPRYRTHAPLIKSVLQGFIITPGHHPGMADFLRQDIGEVARPYLEETARDHPRKKVRERAESELERY